MELGKKKAGKAILDLQNSKAMQVTENIINEALEDKPQAENGTEQAQQSDNKRSDAAELQRTEQEQSTQQSVMGVAESAETVGQGSDAKPLERVATGYGETGLREVKSQPVAPIETPVAVGMGVDDVIRKNWQEYQHKFPAGCDTKGLKFEVPKELNLQLEILKNRLDVRGKDKLNKRDIALLALWEFVEKYK